MSDKKQIIIKFDDKNAWVEVENIVFNDLLIARECLSTAITYEMKKKKVVKE